MSRRLRGALFCAWCLTGFLAASAPATAQGHTANLNGASLYYEDAGEVLRSFSFTAGLSTSGCGTHRSRR